MKHEKEENNLDRIEVRNESRKPYHTPHLTVFGSLKELTQNVGNGAIDFPMGSHIAG